MGEAASSRTVLIRKRPSRATSYWRPWTLSTPPPKIRVRNSATGTPGSSVVPVAVIVAAIISPLGPM